MKGVSKTAHDEQKTVIEVRDLRIGFEIERKIKPVVFGVDFRVEKGEVLTVLGESGSGKSVLGSAILKLLPYNAHVEGGIFFENREILAMPEPVFRKLRGKGIAAAMQGGEAALDPLVPVNRQMAEGIMYHENLSFKTALPRVEDLLVALGIGADRDETRRIMAHYPYQLSGGMNQRILLGMTVLLRPEFLLLDEPTKGLDEVSKADTVRSLEKLREETKSAVLLITHDINLAGIFSDRIMVMYAGQIVEILAPEKLSEPQHPYTIGLLASSPEGGFIPIPGSPPDSRNMPLGCHFFPRCAYASPRCAKEMPELIPQENRGVRCFKAPGQDIPQGV
ncbi:MAG: ABC transporter ATP-binding protein [Treponema sp.]|jgi:peptide/nickel transport system ATP-binding protein|nr:ABC transporter ATP-binding protein [Treponema sp.]